MSASDGGKKPPEYSRDMSDEAKSALITAIGKDRYIQLARDWKK